MPLSRRPRLGDVGKYLLIGLLVREVFSFWTGHPFDFEIWVRVGYYVTQGLNPYGPFDAVLHPGLSFAYFSVPLYSIGYPPFWAYISAFMYGLYSIAGSASPMIYYFLLKQPVILGDLLLGYGLYRYIGHLGKESGGLWALRFWMFSPYTIIISAIWGMFDALAMALAVTALLFADTIKSAVGVGLGVFLKGIPALLLPGLTSRDLRRTVALWSISLSLVFSLTVIPFLIFGWDLTRLWETGAHQASKFSEGFGGWYILYLLQYLSSFGRIGLEGILPLLSLLWIPAVLAIAIVAIPKLRKNSNPRVRVTWLLAIVLVFLLARISTNEQHVLYALPLMLIDVAVWHKERARLLQAVWIISLVYLLTNNVLLIRFLAPVAEWAWPLDISINNTPPTEALRYVLKLGLGFAFALTLAQYLLNLMGRRSTDPYVWRMIRTTFRRGNARYFAYFLSVWWGSTLVDFTATQMITDWDLVIQETIIWGIPIFGWYHISLLLVALLAIALISLFARVEGAWGRVRLFLLLFFLSMVAAGFAEPTYRVLAGSTPLSGESAFLFTEALDDRVFVFGSIGFGFLGMWLVSEGKVIGRVIRAIRNPFLGQKTD